ncbi:19561_t:CDS:1, partial [Gigaspora rosea]
LSITLDVIKIKKTERIGNSIFSWTATVDYGIYLGNGYPTTVSKMDAQIGSWVDFF